VGAPGVQDSDVFVSPWSFDPASEPPAPQDAAATPDILLPPPGPDSQLEPMALFRSFNSAIEERLVVAKGAPHVLVEQFRRLAATLHHAQLVQNTKILMVTSANQGDGKTLTSTNLALTLSESYRRDVLLIDADLRRPSMHEIFRVPNVAGLNEGLKNDGEAKLCALKITSTLTLLPAGRPDPDPMSSLTSNRMRRILQEASARFNWVIIDTAPIGLLADASILGTMVDGVLLVVRAGETSHGAVLKAVEAFGRERILGVVLNAAELTGDEATAARYYGGAQPAGSGS
jgi:capsular exopolysaccharide synthesis family protein